MASGVLIDEKGEFKRRIGQDLNLASESRPAAVVSIIGAQSSGKSTLLNGLFGTDFEVLDQPIPSQMTKGIWVAKYSSPRDGFPILVIDTEGSDGAERKDDVKSAKQTAAFSLAISNTVIMNMKYDNVNHRNSGGWEILRAVLEVLPRIHTQRKVTLVFVIRDNIEASREGLKRLVVRAMEEMWKEIKITDSTIKEKKITDSFQIEVETLPHRPLERTKFDTEVASLKEKIMGWTPSGEHSAQTIGASGFAEFAQNIWDDIKKDKNLDLPQRGIMVSQVRCSAIAEEKCESFLRDGRWIETQNQVALFGQYVSSICEGKQVAGSPDLVRNFGQKVSSICKDYLSQYDKHARHFHQEQRGEYRRRLTEMLIQKIEPTYRKLVDGMSRATLKKFLDGAEEKINKDTALDNMKTEGYITELRNNLKGAAIRLDGGAGLDDTVNQIFVLKLVMDNVIAQADALVNGRAIEEMLIENKNRWKKLTVASAFAISVAGVAGAVGVAIVAPLAPVLAPVAALALGHTAMGAAILKGAAPAFLTMLGHNTSAVTEAMWNSKTVQSLADLMAPILKKALEARNTDSGPSSSAAETAEHD